MRSCLVSFNYSVLTYVSNIRAWDLGLSLSYGSERLGGLLPWQNIHHHTRVMSGHAEYLKLKKRTKVPSQNVKRSFNTSYGLHQLSLYFLLLSLLCLYFFLHASYSLSLKPAEKQLLFSLHGLKDSMQPKDPVSFKMHLLYHKTWTSLLSPVINALSCVTWSDFLCVTSFGPFFQDFSISLVSQHWIFQKVY